MADNDKIGVLEGMVLQLDSQLRALKVRGLDAGGEEGPPEVLIMGAGLDLTKASLGYKCNPDGDDPDEVRIYAGEIDRVAVAQTDVTVADNGYVYVRRTIANNTMLVTTAASVPANDATYLYYRLYRFTVTGGAASILSIFRPFDIEGSSGFTGTVTVITSMQYASNALQYKTKLLTYTNGVLVSVGTESAWVTLFTAVAGCPA